MKLFIKQIKKKKCLKNLLFFLSKQKKFYFINFLKLEKISKKNK